MKLFLNRSESVALRRCLSMLQVSRSGFALSLLLGVTALGAGGCRYLGPPLRCLACPRTLPVAPRLPQGGADGHGQPA